MLTVKVILEDNTEFVKEAISVIVQPLSDGGRRVDVFREDNITEYIDSGDVYVMNSNGKTIGDYHLHPITK
jgi:hypothetical protein